MFKKRAFVHHYIGEGMDESFFVDAKNDIYALIEDYKEIETWMMTNSLNYSRIFSTCNLFEKSREEILDQSVCSILFLKLFFFYHVNNKWKIRGNDMEYQMLE